MMLAYKDIAGYLHYYAYRFETNWFEHDELVNEAWIVVHKLNCIEFASQGIRWAMITYRLREDRHRHHGRPAAKVISLETEIGVDRMLKDTLSDPRRYKPNVDDVDTIGWLANNAHLSTDERILLDQRFWKCMTIREIAKSRERSNQAVTVRLKRILNRLCKAACMLERRDSFVSAR